MSRAIGRTSFGVDGNPLEDPSVLGRVKFVMKDGKVYRNDWAEAIIIAIDRPTGRRAKDIGAEVDPIARGLVERHQLDRTRTESARFWPGTKLRVSEPRP